MLENLKTALLHLLDRASVDGGQAMTEYALVLALIALVTVLALAMLGGGVTNAVSTVAHPI